MHNGRFRLFHLEDDDNDATLVERALLRSHRACDVTRFSDPVTAIEHLENIAAPELHAPHVILSDLKMPKMSGLDFVKWLRASRFSCIPVIILTGSTLAEDVLATYRSGANSFSSKPHSAHELNDLIGTVLRYWNDACRTPVSILQQGTWFPGAGSHG